MPGSTATRTSAPATTRTHLQHAVLGLVTALAACTGRGVDRAGSVAVRGTLSVRPVVDEGPFLDAVVDIARAQPDEVLGAKPLDLYGIVDGREQLTSTHGLYGRAREEMAGLLPPPPAGTTVAFTPRHPGGWELLLVGERRLELSSETRIKLDRKGQHGPEVYLLLTPEDGHQFERLTREFVAHRMAVMHGDDALMAPTVREPIPGSQVLVDPGASSADTLYQQLTGVEPPDAAP